MKLKGQSISYASFKINKKNNLEKELINKITYLEKNSNENNFGELGILKQNYRTYNKNNLNITWSDQEQT